MCHAMNDVTDIPIVRLRKCHLHSFLHAWHYCAWRGEKDQKIKSLGKRNEPRAQSQCGGISHVYHCWDLYHQSESQQTRRKQSSERENSIYGCLKRTLINVYIRLHRYRVPVRWTRGLGIVRKSWWYTYPIYGSTMRAKRFRKEWICEVQYYAKSVIANNGWVCGADKHHCACTLRIVDEGREGDEIYGWREMNVGRVMYASDNSAVVKKQRYGDGCLHHRQQEQLVHDQRTRSLQHSWGHTENNHTCGSYHSGFPAVWINGTVSIH